MYKILYHIIYYIINYGSPSVVLEGGPGADQLIGQPVGSDTASYEHATAGVTANLNNIPGSNTGDAVGDTYTNIANLRGSHFNDTLIGDNNNNVLDGYGTQGGSDILTGNGGADTFVFGGSNVTVTDFSHAQHDQIDLGNLNFGAGIDASALQALIDAAPVNAHTLDFGNGNGNVLTLTNVDVHTLQTTGPTSDFILHH